jgi:hypothetical protein
VVQYEGAVLATADIELDSVDARGTHEVEGFEGVSQVTEDEPPPTSLHDRTLS